MALSGLQFGNYRMHLLSIDFYVLNPLEPKRKLLLAAESVTMAPDGRLIMLDKYGMVWEASETKKDQYELNPVPLAHLGSGRPLGAGFDKDGNMIICDAMKVRCSTTERVRKHLTQEPLCSHRCHLGELF